MPDRLSIVICTYNPQEGIFARALNAVASLRYDANAQPECVIVDNNSNPPVQQMACVQEFLRAWGNARVVREEIPGLMYARLAGIRATSGDVIVSFDDDNAPGADYLQVVAQSMRDYPWVGVWGAGRIDVELLDQVPSWLQERARAFHNQRSHRSIQYGFTPGDWKDFYPIGMGQVMRRTVAESYRSAVETGRLGATGRKGTSMTSGEDVQIVWHAMGMGLAAGSHPELAITHLIPKNRTKIRYLMRLTFGLGSSYHPARAQLYPHEYPETPPYVASSRRLLMRLGRVAWKSMKENNVRLVPVDVAGTIGDICGYMTARGYRNDHWMFKLATRLGLR